MTHTLIKHVQQQSLRNHPEIRTGYTVKVHQRIREGNKERVQVFEGLVIKVSHGSGTDKTFTVRRVVSGIGVEKIFPFHSGTIVKIEVVKKAKVRRAKLYYMRDRSGKSARLKEDHVKITGDMSKVHQEQPESEVDETEAVTEEAAVSETPETAAENTEATPSEESTTVEPETEEAPAADTEDAEPTEEEA